MDACTCVLACVHACRDTNILWKHGILQEKEARPEGRISVIAWGWIQGQEDVHPCPPLLGQGSYV